MSSVERSPTEQTPLMCEPSAAETEQDHIFDSTEATHPDVVEEEKQNAASAPEMIRKFISSVGPFLNTLITVLSVIFSIVEPIVVWSFRIAHKIWTWLAPIHPEQLITAMYGLVLMFFGGAYMLTLAAVEAFRIFGWDKVKVNIISLYRNFKLAKEASDRDDLLDENEDGIPDVRQISKREYMTRKTKVILKSVNPDEVTDAVAGTMQGWFAVLATLKMQFAQAITIGVTLGEIGERVTGARFRKILYILVPDEYEKWVPALVKYGWRIGGVWFSFLIQRAISAFYSSIRGAELFLWGILTYLVRQKIMSKTHVEPGTLVFTILISILGGFGFYWQLSHYFQLPFPLNILFFPLTLVEWFLTISVAVAH